MFEPDVLPLPIAESDFPLPVAVAEALHAAVDRSDTGYHFGSDDVAEAFAGFAGRHWNWAVDTSKVKVTTDVSVGIVESLRQVTTPGDRVIICPPVYPPFFDLPAEAGCALSRVSLLGDAATGWKINFAGIERELAAGTRAILWCSPHNPIGRVWSRAELSELAALVAKHEAWLISDEIHAPLTLGNENFVPYLDVSDAAREHGITVTSASKAFNLAGLKCAHMVAGSDRAWAPIAAMPYEVEWRAGLFGAIANVAAYRDSDEWLREVRERLAENTALLSELLERLVPEARYLPGTAGYLAWVDMSATSLGRRAAERLLTEAKLAVSGGKEFGAPDHIRLNLACRPEILTEAVERIAALARA